RTGRPVAGPAEVARRSAVPVTSSPLVAGRERGIAVRALRAVVVRVGVPRVAVAEVVHGGLLVRRARAVGRLEHIARLRVELPEAVGPGDLGPERRLAPPRPQGVLRFASRPRSVATLAAQGLIGMGML